jgi:uncharacterized protein
MARFSDDHRRWNAGLMALGFFTALFSAGVGIGGGTILVSILMSGFGFDFKKAAGASLSTIIPITLVGSLSHFLFLPKIPNPGHYFIFIPACVLGTVLAGRMARKQANARLKAAFFLFLLMIGLRMLKIYDFPFLFYSGLSGALLSDPSPVMVLMGIAIGMTGSLLGIGCGLLITPFFVIVIGLDMRQAISLSLAAMFCLSLSATLVRGRMKNLDFAPLKSLLIPALAGAVVGAMVSNHLPAPALKKLFAVFLLLTALKYIIFEWAIRGRSFANRIKGRKPGP